jgi:hypothetical protein
MRRGKSPDRWKSRSAGERALRYPLTGENHRARVAMRSGFFFTACEDRPFRTQGENSRLV